MNLRLKEVSNMTENWMNEEVQNQNNNNNENNDNQNWNDNETNNNHRRITRYGRSEQRFNNRQAQVKVHRI